MLSAGFSLPPALSLDIMYKQQGLGPRMGSKGQPPAAKKGAPWSDDEHKAFLAGLKMYGRGQWKQISRYYVPSRTPTQVASHAQKHFLRQSGAQKRRSRFSAVEEAAVAGPAAAAAPLPVLHHHVPAAVVAAAPAAGAPAPPAPPSLFAHALPPAQHSFHLLPPRLLAGGDPPPLPGTVVGGIAMGVPIGVLPPIPSIITASGTELPILPVMPGRINAITSASATAAMSYSGDSFSFCAGEAQPQPQAAASSKPPSPRPQLPPVPELKLYPPAGGSGGAARFATAPASPAPTSSYMPSGRAQELLRLLELNEQLTSSSSGGGPEGTTSGSEAQQAAHHQQQQQQQHCSVVRVPSATLALDTLALLAEAEAESRAEPQQMATVAAATSAAALGEQLAPPVPPVQPAQAPAATA